jgi:hypothetical protein
MYQKVLEDAIEEQEKKALLKKQKVQMASTKLSREKI